MPSTTPNIPVKGMIETSFIDWRGHIASVLFLGGCNFRCPFCHNKDLVLTPTEMVDIPLDHIILILRRYKRWVERVVISGGEPTIHKELSYLAEKIKGEGLLIKLDTNGSNPSMIKALVKDGLIDYIAMDIKGPLIKYNRWCGVEVDIGKIEESIRFIMEGHVDYEFRMTVVPFFHKEEDCYEICDYIKGAKRFFIQNFRPINTLNPAFSNIRPFSEEKIRLIMENVLDRMASSWTRHKTIKQP